MPSKSSTAKQAADSRSKPSSTPQTLPVQNLPATSSTEVNKKKKKKKNKVKATSAVPESRVEPKYEEEEEEEDDDIPPLEPAPGLYRSLTGLPPELEAVHLSATASLSATVAAAARNNPTAAAHAELIAAADDLCRRMDADPQGGIATDDDYWKSLPEHIRNFVSPNWLLRFVFIVVTDTIFFSRPKLCTRSHNRWSSRPEARVPRNPLLDTRPGHFLRQIYPLISRSFRAHRLMLSWSRPSHHIIQRRIARLLLAVRDLYFGILPWHEPVSTLCSLLQRR